MKKVMPLSDTTIRNIKVGDARKQLSDGDSLYLKLFVNGGAHGWRLDYTFDGVRKTISLGTYPDTGLKLARDKAAHARSLVAAGIDPSEKRKDDKMKAKLEREMKLAEANGIPLPGTFEYVARQWYRPAMKYKSVGMSSSSERGVLRVFYQTRCAQGKALLADTVVAVSAWTAGHHCPTRVGLSCGPELRSGKCLLHALAAHRPSPRCHVSFGLAERICPTAVGAGVLAPPNYGTAPWGAFGRGPHALSAPP